MIFAYQMAWKSVNDYQFDEGGGAAVFSFSTVGEMGGVVESAVVFSCKFFQSVDWIDV